MNKDALSLSSYTEFSWKTYSLLHGEGVLKIGTDAILLGTWINKVVESASHILDAIEARKADIVRQGREIIKADLVISNPPFYNHQLVSPEKSKRVAKHLEVSPSTWMASLAACARATGKLTIIVPGDEASLWIRGANHAKWYCNQRMEVFSFATDDKPVRSLLLFSQQLQQPGIQSLFLYDQPNTLTDQYKAWLK